MWPFTKWSRIQRELDNARKEFETLKVLAARPLVQNVRASKLFSSLHEAEFMRQAEQTLIRTGYPAD